MTAPERAPLGATLALLIAVVSMTGSLSPMLMAASIALFSLVLGLAWPALLELPSPVGTRVVVAGTGILGALVAVLAPERLSPVSGVVMVCAAGVFASFLHQMLRRERRHLTESLTGTVAGAFVSGISASWVIAQSAATGGDSAGLITAIAAGLGVTLLLNTSPLPGPVRLALAILAGSAVTAWLLISLFAVAPMVAAGVALVTAIGAGCAHLLAGSPLVAKEPVPSLAVGVVPVATVGVVAHLAVLLI